MVHKLNQDFGGEQGGFLDISKGDQIKHSDRNVFADATSEAIICYFPEATDWGGKEMFIQKTDSSPNTIIVKPKPRSGETMDGKTSIVLTTQYDYCQLVSDGQNWIILHERTNAFSYPARQSGTIKD